MEEDAHLKEADEAAYKAMDEDITAALMSCALLLSWNRVQSAAQMQDNSHHFPQQFVDEGSRCPVLLLGHRVVQRFQDLTDYGGDFKD